MFNTLLGCMYMSQTRLLISSLVLEMTHYLMIHQFPWAHLVFIVFLFIVKRSKTQNPTVSAIPCCLPLHEIAQLRVMQMECSHTGEVLTICWSRGISPISLVYLLSAAHLSQDIHDLGLLSCHSGPLSLYSTHTGSFSAPNLLPVMGLLHSPFLLPQTLFP